MINTVYIFLGAGVGGVCRYWISNAIHWMVGREFPYGTFVVNVSGCFLMGFLFILLLERFDGNGAELRSLILIGLLGGYTTFSSFSIESINLLENGEWLSGFLNISLSVIFCIAASWLGVILGRQL